MDKKDFDKMILILGFALLVTGIVLVMYIATTPNVVSLSIPQNTVPAWFATVIAATFVFLGIVIIAYWSWSKEVRSS